MTSNLPDAIRRVMWFAPPPAKHGHPDDRKAAADLIREQRARFHTLHGGWTRSEWNHQVSQAALNNLERMTDVRKHVQALQEQRNAADASFAAPSKQSDEEWYRARELDRLVMDGRLK